MRLGGGVFRGGFTLIWCPSGWGSPASAPPSPPLVGQGSGLAAPIVTQPVHFPLDTGHPSSIAPLCSPPPPQPFNETGLGVRIIV